ncbi:hypothetical protein C7212DRAFT_339687 [Tuber magnatum]|uniref:Uncharacterized protein n=1 Tax=Tuber magnatum TaxID=42249 RepID=A0A317SEE3_9PEZI|nr:hypothetical protein C7212DRAFT_339687 [Tuber magnatum]
MPADDVQLCLACQSVFVKKPNELCTSCEGREGEERGGAVMTALNALDGRRQWILPLYIYFYVITILDLKSCFIIIPANF